MKAIKIILALMLMLFSFQIATAQEKGQMVRLAKLVIDSAQLEGYKTFLKEEIETSLRVEPGVLTLYAVSEKDNPTHITILEIYKDVDAYQSHIQTPHFIKYKNGTLDMVKSLELVETVPLVTEVEVGQIKKHSKRTKNKKIPICEKLRTIARATLWLVMCTNKGKAQISTNSQRQKSIESDNRIYLSCHDFKMVFCNSFLSSSG